MDSRAGDSGLGSRKRKRSSIPVPHDCSGQQNSEESLDEQLENKILEILHKRALSSTICPSEAARAIAPGNWRPLMEKTREVARRLALRGNIHITQRGTVCDPLSNFTGPIRLKIAIK